MEAIGNGDSSSSNSAAATPSDHAGASLFALGVLLLELLFRETLEQQPFRAELLEPGGVPNDLTDLCTVLRWHRRAEAEFGYGSGDAIHLCLTCAFEPPLDLSQPALVGAVWRNVTQLLEDFLVAWQRDPLSGRARGRRPRGS